MWTVSSLLAKFTAILFPKRCFVCKKEGSSFCEVCLQKRIRSIDTPHLFITSFFSFKDPEIKRAIHAIKYFHRKDLIEPLTMPVLHILENHIHNLPYILVPIPMPRIRRYVRGYNHAELIAKIASKQYNLEVDTHLITRTRSPMRQVASKTRQARLKNQHNSFKASSQVKDKHVLLVDDVTTTGATLHEARDVLLKAGARSVKAFTIAH
jgi:competence protein ComFC